MKASLKGAQIALGITGSIAAYKSCELVRRLKDEGAMVKCLMTPGAQKFVSALTFAALSGESVAVDVWDESLWKMAHISLAEWADILIIAPASAKTLSELAAGSSGCIISATYLAILAPTLIAPAMHEGMWNHPATQENVAKLKRHGAVFVGPEEGALLGKFGMGRLAAVPTIIQTAKKILQQKPRRLNSR